jgi:hypothetical protein
MTNRSLLRMLEREREAHMQERQRLIDTICHLAGKPWTPAPIDLVSEPEPESEDNGRFVLTPESLPDY